MKNDTPFALSLSKGRSHVHQGFDKLSPNGLGRWFSVRPELVEGPFACSQGFDELGPDGLG